MSHICFEYGAMTDLQPITTEVSDSDNLASPFENEKLVELIVCHCYELLIATIVLPKRKSPTQHLEQRRAVFSGCTAANNFFHFWRLLSSDIIYNPRESATIISDAFRFLVAGKKPPQEVISSQESGGYSFAHMMNKAMIKKRKALRVKLVAPPGDIRA